MYEHLQLKKTMIKIDHSWKDKDKDHLELSSNLLNINLKGDKIIEELMFRLDNHIKSI